MSQVFRRIHKYYVGNQIGYGSFSSVRCAYQKDTFEEKAIKMISKKRLFEKCRHNSPIYNQMLYGESTLGSLLTHPRIAKIKEVIQTDGQIFQVMDLYEGDLRQVQFDTINMKEILIIVDDILSAIEYLHMNHICHRDIKIENILIDSNGRAFLSDFSFLSFSLDNLHQILGSVGTTAPEVFDGNYDGLKADIWSFGILLYTLFAKQKPFPDSCDPRTVSLNEIDFSQIPLPIIKIISSCLLNEPQLRPTATKIRRNRIFNCLTNRIVNEKVQLDKPIIDSASKIIHRIAEIQHRDYDTIISCISKEKANEEKILYRLIQAALVDHPRNDVKMHSSESLNEITSCPIAAPRAVVHSRNRSRSLKLEQPIYEKLNVLDDLLIKKRFCISITPDGVRKAVLNTAEDDIEMILQTFHQGDDCHISISGDESSAEEIEDICHYIETNLSQK